MDSIACILPSAFKNVSPSRLLSSGIYTIPEASRLTRVSTSRIRRWMKGYDFRTKRDRHHSNPVWSGQLAPIGDKIAVGFKDLMEIRFVNAFLVKGTKKGSGFNVFSEFAQPLDRRPGLAARQPDQLTDGNGRAHGELFA